MEVRCVRVKLKPGSLERVREWAETMRSRREEALQTMREEGMWVECTFLERTPDGNYLIVFLMAENFERARQVGRQSVHSIDEYHREFRQAVAEEKEDLQLLVDLERVGNEIEGP